MKPADQDPFCLTLYSMDNFLDHDVIFYFQTTMKKVKKNLSKVSNTFENSLENGANAPFPIIFSNT